MTKLNRDFGRAKRQADDQNRIAAAKPGLEAACREGAEQHIARKAKGGDYVGKEVREEPREPKNTDKGKPSQEQRRAATHPKKRHIAIKAAQNGDAIAEASEHMPRSRAIAAIDAKRGSRALRQML